MLKLIIKIGSELLGANFFYEVKKGCTSISGVGCKAKINIFASVWKGFCSLTFVRQYAVANCSYRIPTALGQGIFIAVLNILTNIYFMKQSQGGKILRRISTLSLVLCTGWDAYCTSVYIQYLRDANNIRQPFIDKRIKKELVQYVYKAVHEPLILHAIESVICGYLLIISFITSVTYQYSEGIFSSEII